MISALKTRLNVISANAFEILLHEYYYIISEVFSSTSDSVVPFFNV